MEVVWIAAKLVARMRTVRLKGSLSFPIASSINQDKRSFFRRQPVSLFNDRDKVLCRFLLRLLDMSKAHADETKWID